MKTAKYVTPGDTRLGESILPYVKDSNTILLQNHGTVTFDVDLARTQSEENPIYRIQMAHARMCGIFRQGGIDSATVDASRVDLAVLDTTEEVASAGWCVD